MVHGDTLTPGALAARLSVSDRTVRRMGEAYEQVYEPLPRDRRGHRLFPAEAADRLEVAARALRDSPGLSMVEVLTALRDGQHLPRHADRTPTADALAPLLAELRGMRGELAELRTLLLALRGPERPNTPPAGLFPDSGTANTDAAPSPPRKLQPNHAALLERLQAGAHLIDEGGHVYEVAQDGERRRVDPRTVAALLRYGLLLRDGDGLRLSYSPLLEGTEP